MLFSAEQGAWSIGHGTDSSPQRAQSGIVLIEKYSELRELSVSAVKNESGYPSPFAESRSVK